MMGVAKGASVLIASLALVLVGLVVFLTGHPGTGEEVPQKLQRRKAAGADGAEGLPPCTIIISQPRKTKVKKRRALRTDCSRQ